MMNFEQFSINEKKKAKKKADSETSGLTAKQKKLPLALQASILKRLKNSTKKSPEKEEKEPSEKRTELTAKQKKLPLALQMGILKKMKK